MGITIDNIKHCLKVMVDCEVCEECNLYGTTGTDHCEHDCVYGALDIIDKYQKIEKLIGSWELGLIDNIGHEINEVIEDGNDN